MKVFLLFATIITAYYSLARIKLECELRVVDMKTEARTELYKMLGYIYHTENGNRNVD